MFTQCYQHRTTALYASIKVDSIGLTNAAVCMMKEVAQCLVLCSSCTETVHL